MQGDYDHEKELADMIQMLDSPLFKQIITVQDSIQELDDKIRKTDQVENEDFDFTATGELSWFQQGIVIFSNIILILKRDKNENKALFLTLMNYLNSQNWIWANFLRLLF